MFSKIKTWPVGGLLLASLVGGCMINTTPTPSGVVVVNNAGSGTAQQVGVRPMIRGAESGVRQKIGSVYAVDLDCSSLTPTSLKVVKSPQHGNLAIENGEEFIEYAKDNVRAPCNGKKAPARVLYYTSEPGFVGTDALAVEGITTNGFITHYEYQINVR